MDWANESYVRVYTRETDDDLALSWEAMALWNQMMKKFDRSGIVVTRRGARGLAAMVRLPVDVVERVLPELLEDGRLHAITDGYLSPNFLEAQEAKKSDKLRQKETRERRRDGVTPRDSGVTNRDETVTTGHTASHDVTPCFAVPSLAMQSEALPRAIPPTAVRSPVPVPPTTASDHTGASDHNALVSDGWARLNQLRAAIAAEHGWADVGPLHPFDPGRTELAARLRESGARAAPNLDHVLAVAEREARDKGTVEYLGGSMFAAVSWAKKLAMRISDAGRQRAGPARAAVHPADDPDRRRSKPL